MCRNYLRVRGARAVTPAANAEFLTPLTDYRTVRFTRNAAGAVVGDRVSASLGRAVGGEYVFPAKLAPAAVGLLAAAGRRPSFAYPFVPRAWTLTDPPVPAAALNGPGGATGALLLGYDRPAVERVAVPLIRRYAAARVFVAARNKKEARWWIGAIGAADLPQRLAYRERLGPVREGVDPSYDLPEVYVGTLRTLDLVYTAEDARRTQYDAVVVPDAGPLRATDPPKTAEPELFDAARYRALWNWQLPAFGFLPPGATLRGGDLPRLHGMFGRVVPPPPRPAGPA